MNRISIAINIILVGLLAVAFYQINALKKKVNGETEVISTNQSDSGKIVKPIKIDTSALPDGKIAYINIDSLDANYDYFKDFSKSFNDRKATIERQVQNQMMELENEYVEFQKAVQAGIKPQAELEREQQRLVTKKQNIEAQQGRMEALADEMSNKQLAVRKDLADFLSRFNNGKYDYILPYSGTLMQTLYVNPKMDVTKQVVMGLNAEYKVKKK
jgi:outer membrane protein